MIPVDIRARSAGQQSQRYVAMSEGELRKALVVARGTLARLRLHQDLVDLRDVSTRIAHTARTGARAGALAWAIAAAASAWRRGGRDNAPRSIRWIHALGIVGGLLWRLFGLTPPPLPTPLTSPLTSSLQTPPAEDR